LGLNYKDKNGKELSPAPNDLIRLHAVEWENLDPRLAKTKIYVLCDVKNPLLGPRGSARVFGPQKGATSSDVRFLEKFLDRWSQFAPAFAKATEGTPGAGAAGGLAFGLCAFLGAQLVKGTPFIMDRVKWNAVARRAAVIITGEGRVDKTSFGGKVTGEILRRRGKSHVFLVCGSAGVGARDLKKHGVSAIVLMGPAGMATPAAALAQATTRLIS
jgi:glycerate kinase